MMDAEELYDRAVRRLERRYKRCSSSPAVTPFSIEFSQGYRYVFGQTAPAFCLVSKDSHGDQALASCDLLRVGVAFNRGSLDIEGDMLAAMSSRRLFRDRHPLVWATRFLPALMSGRLRHDARSIATHYDRSPEFFQSFLDQRYLCYTQGDFTSDQCELEDAIERKLARAYRAIGASPGSTILEVGGGWGAFLRYAGARGSVVTSLTLSKESADFMTKLAYRNDLCARIEPVHFLNYPTTEKYDAIVNMGATEHLPDYWSTVQRYAVLLKPGGRVYIDALAMRKKHRVSSFMSKYIYPGRSSPLVLHKYLECVAKSPFLLCEVRDERWNYYLTCKEWACRLDRAKAEVSELWGPQSYRMFRAFLWGAAASFLSGHVQAYSVVLELPAESSFPA